MSNSLKVHQKTFLKLLRLDYNDNEINIIADIISEILLDKIHEKSIIERVNQITNSKNSPIFHLATNFSEN